MEMEPLDCAHNPASLSKLAKTQRATMSTRNLFLVKETMLNVEDWLRL